MITNTIETDLAKSKAELAPKQAQLRKERLRLMQEKIGGTEDLNINDKGGFLKERSGDMQANRKRKKE